MNREFICPACGGRFEADVVMRISEAIQCPSCLRVYEIVFDFGDEDEGIPWLGREVVSPERSHFTEGKKF